MMSGRGPRAAVTAAVALLLVGTCRAADHRADVPTPAAVATSKPPSERPQLAKGGQTGGTPYPSLPVTTGHVEGRSDPPRTSPPVTVTATPRPGPTVTVTRLVRTPARVRPGPTVTCTVTAATPPAPEICTPDDPAIP